MNKPKVCILRTAGTNCDKETAFAFLKVDAEPEFVHINKLVSGRMLLDDFQILALSGGFSYGDDFGAGKILANELKFKLIKNILKFLEQGKLIIGICNGFQVLVKSGLLPGNSKLEQEASLIINDSAKFEARWVYLKSPGHSLDFAKDKQVTKSPVNCVWTQGLPEIIYLPVAHGEGKFVVENNSVLERLKDNGQVVFQYCDEKGKLSGYPQNPNGSVDNIAGICDETGRILGLMPHPERHIQFTQHPRLLKSTEAKKADGIEIFKNGVEYARKNL